MYYGTAQSEGSIQANHTPGTKTEVGEERLFHRPRVEEDQLAAKVPVLLLKALVAEEGPPGG